MSIIKRVNKIQNLDQLSIDFEDTSENSPEVFNVFGLPAEFPAGKTSFLINGSDNLVANSEVRVEILDLDRNVIYTQPIQFLEGVSRLISVFVYPDDSFGEATLTLVGEVFRLPEGFRHLQQATGNEIVRWQKKILINPSLENTSKIRFFRDPKITVSEILRPYLTRTFGGGTSTDELTDGTISGQVAANEYILTSKGFDFRGQMVGATVIVPNPIISDSTVNTIPYTTSITEVKNSKVAIAEFAYQIQTDEEKAIQTIEQKVFQFPPPNTFNFLDSPYTMSILTEPTFSSTQNIRAFARVRVANMTPFSGDVNLVKLYMKSEGSVGDFELIADQVLESVELLVDSSSVKFNTPTGYFFEQSSIDSFWSASQNDLTIPTASLIYKTDKIIDSMLISGSDEKLPIDSFYKVENTQPVEFDEGAEYTFEAQFYAVKKQAQELLSPERTFGKNNQIRDVNLAKIQIYMSGSAFASNPPGKRAIGEKPEFGKLIQEIELASNSIPDEKTIGNVETNFTANKNGTGTVIFIVEAGDWHIHNVTVKLGQETGFSPDLTTFFIPLPDWEKNDPIKFKAEFFDINNNRASTFVTSSEFIFEGGNSYIGGENNLLTGSLFIGNLTGSGIEMAGVESAFIRTVGYKGFVSASRPGLLGGPGGFMMWSGAVTLGRITDEYDAVGLELHGGSGSAINPDTLIGETHALRFRTDTGILEITGAIVATFISASAGEIGGWAITTSSLKAISGSMELFSDGQIFTNNFVINEDGDVTASQFLFQGGRITGSNVFIEVPNFELDATNVEISSINASMSLGEGNDGRITIQGSATPFIAISQSKGSEAFKTDGIFIGFTDTLGAKSGTLSLESSTGTEYLRWDGTNLEISTSVLVLTTSSLDIAVSDIEIDANNFELSTDNASMSLGEEPTRITMKGQENPFISIQQSTKAFTEAGVFLGSTAGLPQVSFENPSGSEFLRWDGTKLTISASGFSLDSDGNITSSGAKIFGDNITIDVNNFELDAPNIEISSNNASMSIGEGKILISGSNRPFVGIGIPAPTDFKDDGIYLGVNGDNGLSSASFESPSSNEFLRWDGLRLTISASGFSLDVDGNITASNGLFDGTIIADAGFIGGFTISQDALTGQSFFLSGSPATPDGFFISASNFVVRQNGDITGSQVLFTGGTIAGWQITPTLISGTNLLLDPAGTIQTADFVSDLKGWRITSDFNGLAEFENAKIRGTLSTTVFLKETVNAVGGQLWVANSTALSGSITASATETTFSVENASAWTLGEIAIIKKVSNTGFATEYIRIESASFDGDGETEFNGKIFVIRNFSGSIPFPIGFVGGVSGSLSGDTASLPTQGTGIANLQPGQSIVSTGLSGSGYIRLNANPRDFQTPYIDIIERTGSGVFDLELKARVGDLKGLSPTLLFGNQNPGFGIFTENGFFQGAITAVTGTFTGIMHAGGVQIGKNVSELDITGSGILINTNNFWLDQPNFRIGNAFNFISGGAAEVFITTTNFELDANNIELSSQHASMSLGEGKILLSGSDNPFISIDQIGNRGFSQSGIFLGFEDDKGQFSLQNSVGSRFLRFNSDDLEIATENFELDANNLELSSTQASMSLGEGKIVLSGSLDTPFMAISQSTFGFKEKGIFLGFVSQSGGVSGTLSLESSTGTEYLRWDGTNLEISTSVLVLTTSSLQINIDDLEIDATNFELSTANASMSLGEGNKGRITLQGQNDPFLSISQSKGAEAFKGDGIFIGFTASDGVLSLEGLGSEFLRWDGTKLTISASGFSLDSDGNISASNAFISGTIQANAGEIGGFTITDEAIASTNLQLVLSGSGAAITASNALISGTNVVIETQNFELDALNIEISSQQASMSLGEGGIVLSGSEKPFIAISQSSFGFANDGIFLGFDDATKSASLSLVNSDSDEFLKWDGRFLEISTSVLTLTSSSLTLNVQDLEIDANNFEVSTANASMSLGEGAGRITLQGKNNTPFIALSQSIGSEAFKANGIFIGFVTASGKSSGTLSLEGTNDEFLRWDGNKLTVSASGFSLDDAGNITASNALIEGIISASAGEIGGWQIQLDRIKANASEMFLSGSGFIATSTGSRRIELSGPTNNLKFFGGSGNNNVTIGNTFIGTIVPLGETAPSTDGILLKSGTMLALQSKIVFIYTGSLIPDAAIAASNFQNRIGIEESSSVANRFVGIEAKAFDSNDNIGVTGSYYGIRSIAFNDFNQGDAFALYGRSKQKQLRLAYGDDLSESTTWDFIVSQSGDFNITVGTTKKLIISDTGITSGFVGIGTTFPANRLHLRSDDVLSNSQVQCDQAGTGDAGIGFRLVGGQAFSMGIDNSISGDPFVISDNVTLGTNNRFVIIGATAGVSNVGDIGIGTDNPAAKLHVVGNDSVNKHGLFIDGDGDSTDRLLQIRANTTVASITDSDIIFQVLGSGAVLMSGLATANASVLQVNTTTGLLTFPVSSKRYKKKIKNIEIDTSKLYNLRPVSFNYKNDKYGDKRDFGLIAEEVFEEIPQLIALNKEGQPENVNYSMLSVILLNELKKNKKEQDEKDKKMESLEERLEKLEKLLLN